MAYSEAVAGAHAVSSAGAGSVLRYALFTVPLVLVLGYLSGRVSGSGAGNAWFDALDKPRIMPPGWAFGLAWTILYILLGVVLAILFTRRNLPRWRLILALFIAQLLINYTWSPVFFGLHQITLGLVIILAILLLSIAVTILLWPLHRIAAVMMLPYLAWLGFATLLNWQILQLNPQ